LLVRTPRFEAIGAFAIASVVMLALGYLAWTSREPLDRNDSLRVTMPLVAALTIAAAAFPIYRTCFPPRPAGGGDLAAPETSVTMSASGLIASAWIEVRGGFVNTATGAASYVLTVTGPDGSRERIAGSIHPHAGGPVPEHHLLATHGPGTYMVRLEGSSDALALPLHVALYSRPFATLWLVLLFGVLAVAILAIDVMLWRRGHEPAYAASMLLLLVAAVYFQSNPMPESLKSELLASGIVGVLGGGAGGELIARGIRMIVGK
jgi:hypothetical protein